MTAAEKYRQLEISPSVQVARWIFNNRLNHFPTIPLREVVEDIKTGKTPSKDEKKYYENGVLDWFKPSEIGESKYLVGASDKLSQLAVDTKQATIYQPGTLLIIGIGAGIGRLAITKDIASSNQQITGIAFNKLVLPEYAYYYFLAYREFFYIGASKSTIPIINQKKITSIPFIICSINEQKLITEFLAAIELIKLPQDVEGLSSLTDDIGLLEAAKGIFAIHFASATLVSEFDKQQLHLTQLRQALLREAMQGQLLPQDPTDEPAAELLQQLQTARATTGKKGRDKAGALFAEAAEAVEGPLTIPASWVWARLGDTTKFIDYRGKTPTKTESGVKLITAKNVKRGYFSEHPQEFISEADIKTHMTRGWPIKGDVLFTTEAPLGNACLLNHEPPFALAQRIITLQPKESVLNTFLLQAILSEGVQAQLKEKASGATAQGIKSSRLVDVLIPLPPLAEQNRIVAKLEQLLGHCDALEQRIRESRRLAEQLLATALREALAPSTGTTSPDVVELELVEAAETPASRAPRRGVQLALGSLLD